MSVRKNERGESTMNFVEIADRLEDEALEMCKKWPKTYTFLLTNRTVNLASEVYECVLSANAIIPETEKEKQNRVALLQRATGALRNFARKVEKAKRRFPLCGYKEGRSNSEEQEKSDKIFEKIMDLCDEEEKAIEGNINYTRSIKVKSQ